MDSDIDRSLLSRPVTKLSRSTAVTTPNTICFRLGEPSVRSGKGERGQTLMRAQSQSMNESTSNQFVLVQVDVSAKFEEICSHPSWDIAIKRMGRTTEQHYTSEPSWTWSYKCFNKFPSLPDFDSLYQKGLSVGSWTTEQDDCYHKNVGAAASIHVWPAAVDSASLRKTLHVQRSVWAGTKTACVTGSMLHTSISCH